ncbi:hypothetical protein KBJ98_00270 [Flavobacterium sp. F-328]|uniref:Lipoprotein n=1 Tax=Flavobacterium erciyesense TaxID=2825842 RepID=A0ABS5CZE1_9FLAO|nr:hypothetical protein [Flavobacterium erciyesense]MBQ0907133.1 hypothetical protein [Flavobacterium erciyesense]
MKSKILILGLTLGILSFNSCTNESEPVAADTIVTTNEVAATQKMDNAVDDIAVIVDDQYELSEGTSTGRTIGNYHSILPTCATVSDLGSTATVRKITITFGNPNTAACLFRGQFLKGQIILTRTVGTTFPKIMTVTFNNFYINDNKLEGTSTWKREMIGTGNELHPKTTFSMNAMTWTTREGVYSRKGERIREMVAGFATRLNLADDVFATYGTFTTKHPNGSIYTWLVAKGTALIHKTACSLQKTPMPFPVSGKLKISKESHYAIIEYGNGECDNLAMLAIDGGQAKPIILGN